MTYYLVEYDRRAAKSEVTELDDSAAALALLSEKERGKPPEMEVVLLMADSLADLAVTHGRYFRTSRELVADLRALLTAP